MNGPKIYFAGSIRGSREDTDLYREIIIFLSSFGVVLTEHVGNKKLSSYGNKGQTVDIYKKDMGWLTECDLVIAEVSTPSLGTGYEVAKAEEMEKPVLCLYRKQKGKRLSAMILGNPQIKLIEYKNVSRLKEGITDFIQESAAKVQKHIGLQ